MLGDAVRPLLRRAGHRAGAVLAARSRANLALVARVREIAERLGCAPGQLALARSGVDGVTVVPIPGTKRVRYLEENVAATGVEITAEGLAALEEAVPRDAVVGARYGGMSPIES